MTRLAYIGLAIAAVVVILAILAPLIATHDPTSQDLGRRFISPSSEHWFGTDGLGRDVFSRVIYGTRVSLQVGITVVLISGVIGIIIGSIAGFYGGWADKFLSGYLFNVFLAFPGLLLAIALAAFVDEHNMPNAIQPLIVQASLGMAGAVLSEASLSFLGLGIPPPAPSWGTMIEEARNYFSTYPHTLFFPGAAIALTVLAFNFIGDGLREYLDPKQRAR